MKRIIERTEDGSATLFVPELNEHYHSVKGAHTESQHIFIEMGLKEISTPDPQILEVGFGTGLNALLTLEEAERSQRRIHYTGVELYPLDWQEVEVLHYSDNPLFEKIHQAPWNEDVNITEHFILHKLQADLTKDGSPFFANGAMLKYDGVYFDAFAPEKQPEMWSENLFKKLYEALHPNGILTTYCAKGVIRRLLQTIGFTVERLPGPPQGKREILRGRKEMNNIQP